MKISLFQSLSQASNALEAQLLKGWQDLADDVGKLIEETHAATEKVLEENASLQKENSAASSYLQQRRVSHLSLVKACEERIALLKQEEIRLSGVIAEIDASTCDSSFGSFQRYKELVELFLGYASEHTHDSITSGYSKKGAQTSKPIYKRH